MTCSNPVQEKNRHNPLPSRRSMTGPRMPSAVWATSDLEMAWPWPPPFTSDNCLPICFTELSTFPRKLKMDSVQLPYEPMYLWLGGRLVGWLIWWLVGLKDGWSVGRMVGRSVVSLSNKMQQKSIPYLSENLWARPSSTVFRVDCCLFRIAAASVWSALPPIL